MKKKVIILGVLLAMALLLAFSLAAPAMAEEGNTIESSAMVFQGELTVNGEGYTGTLAMVEDGGFDIYARNGATATFLDDRDLVTPTIESISNNDAWPTWTPDTPDWGCYALTFTEDNKWLLVYNENTPRNWADTGAVPMSGTMDWTNMYAAETNLGYDFGDDRGKWGAPEDDPDYYGFAAANGGGAACWDIDWIWGSEVVPLAFPGFLVTVTEESGVYTVTLTPADGRAAGIDSPGPVVNDNTGESYGTIQSAIDAANDGDIINVAAGDYDEAVVIPAGSNLSLIGAGRDAVNWVAPPGTACISCDLSGYTGATTLEIAGFNFSFETTATEGGQGVGLKIYGASSGPLYLDVYDNTFIGTTDTVTVGNTDNSMWLCHNRYAARNGDAPVKIHDNIDQSTGGICMSNSQAFDIYENTFDGCSDALYIAHGCPTCTIGDHHIYENTFQNADNEIMGSPKDCPSIYFGYRGSPAGMTFLPNIIEENTFEGNDIAIGYYMDEDVSPPDIIRHNSFINNQIGVKVEGTYTPIINAVGNWWGSTDSPVAKVSGDVDYSPWLGAVPGTVPMTWYTNDSIQDAINAASAGDTINVAAGEYNERITITKPLTLLGATHGVNKNGYTVPEGYAWDTSVETVLNNPAPAPTGTVSVVLIEDVNNVTFDGFVVQSLNAPQGSQNDMLVTVRAETMTMDNINIMNCVIGPNTNTVDQDGTAGRMGLYIALNQYQEVPYGLINSTFSGLKIFGCEGNGNNVFIWGAYYSYGARYPSPMGGTVFEDCEIYGSHRSGFETGGGFTGLTIRDTVIYSNSGLVTDDPNNLKYGNGMVFVRGSSDSGEQIGLGPENLTLENVEIYGNEKNGIYMGPVNNNISFISCDIHDNGWDGIRLDMEAHFKNPDFEEEDRVGFYEASEDVSAHLCSIYDNVGYGVQVIGIPTNGFTFNAVGNWWGDPSGPTHTSNPGGAGDEVSGNVAYDPWYIDEGMTTIIVPEINHGTFGGIIFNQVNAGAVADYKAEADSIAAGGYISDTEYHTMEAVRITDDQSGAGAGDGIAGDDDVYLTDRGGCIYIQSVVTGLKAGDIVEVDNNYFYNDGTGYGSFWDQEPYWIEIGDYTHKTEDTILNWLIYSENDGSGTYTLVIGSGEYNLATTFEDVTYYIGHQYNLTREVKVYRNETLSTPVTSSSGYTTSTNEDPSGWSEPLISISLDTGDLTYVAKDMTYVDDDWAGSDNGDIVGEGYVFGQDAFASIQQAVDGTVEGGTVNVAAGEYAGAVVNKSVKLIGAEGGSSVMTSGVPYKEGNSALYTAFRPEADGCEIRNFTINCDTSLDLDLAIYAIEVDAVTVDSLTINDNGTVQGITNWGGSNWVITNNTINSTVAASGGGIGIFIGAKAQQQCTGNLVQDNSINATATAESYSCPGILLCLDTRYGQYDLLNGTEDISGNQILDNTITATGVNNGVGIEVGTILGDSPKDPARTDADKIAALMRAAALHDNTVQGNTINGAETGIYIYNVTGLSITQNTIENSVSDGIFAEHGQSGSVIQNNTFSDNDIQLTDNTGTLDIGGILANNTFDRAVTVDRPGSSLLPAIWSNIQDAITAASPGDTVNVAPGLYSERIVIDKPLTLLGATHGVNKNGYNVPAGYAWDTSVESVINNPDPALTGTISVVLIKDTDDVTFDGFVVQSLNAPQGSQNDMLVTVLAETTTMNNITITNNVIGPNTNIDPLVQNGDAGRMGLYVSVHHFSGAEVFGLTDSSIANNKIFGCEGDGDNVFVWGTYASTSAPGPAPMTDTFIEDNEIYGSHRSGIETAGGISGLTIQGNDIYGNSGLSTDPDILKYGSGITLVRASSDRTPAGFGPVNVTIDGNIIHNNQKHGIYLDPNNKDIYITNNTFYENGYDAIVVDLIGNYFNLEFDLTEGPYTNLGGSENIVIYHNDIDSGAVYGVTVTGTPTNDFRLNATYNYWGVKDADVATKVIGNVDFDPWHLKQLEADTVADAKKTTSSVILTWTAEGTWPEDYYDFRYSTSPIDGDAAWAAATKIVNEPAPVENKKQEMIVRNLNSGTTYYFALVITDGANRSDISTIVVSTNTVVTPDTTPPADITGLTAAAGDPATTSVRLSWTATGDDGTTGFAARYIIKRSTSEINSTADFNAATTVFNSLTPKAYGEQETFTVTRLNPDTTYYFAVQAEDEAGNKSAVSTKSRKTDSNLPTVTGITADPAGTHNGEARTLTFTGVHFANAGAVKVRLVSGDNLLSLVSVNLINDTQLSAEVPKGVPTGTYQARVINNNGTSALSTATYTVTAAPVPVPVVTNVIPNLAASNTAVTGVEIFGQHFTGATAVTVNGREADSFTVNSNTKITADIPGLSAGEYDVKVTTPAGTNGISAVKFIVSVPVNVTGNDTTTSGIIDLSGTGGNTQGQITLTTDNTGNSTQNTDADVEIEVVIPPGTEVTDNNGNPYTGTINPPRVIKPDPSVHTELPADALVIEMGNPAQTINFGQDFVTTVKVTGTTAPLIYYLNKDSGEYELAGKDGVKDGITYRVGGTVLNVENLADGLNLYTIGLLLDHMSVYVSSTESLLPGEPSTPSPGGGGVGGGGVPPSGTTNIRGKVSSTGRFLETVLATTMDQTCSLTIPFGTVGLDKDLKPLTSITMLTTDVTPSLPENWNVIGMAYDFGPSGAGFDPAITLKWKYNPEDLPAGANGNELKLAYYNAETGEWVILDSTVDVEKNTVTAKITHFTTFALIDIHKVATFTVGSLEISPSQVTPGETATVGLTVTNTGNKDGSYTVSLLINGVKESEKTVTVAAGASRVVSFDIVKETAGTYTIDLNGLTGSLKVTSIAAPEPVETPEPEPAPAPTSAPPETTPAQTQTVTPEPGANWTIIWAVIVAALVIAGALAILWLKRRRA